jgi:hypothetical protein
MPEPGIRQPLRPLEVETRQRTELLYFLTYQKRGALTIASDHLVVGKGNSAVSVGRDGLIEATYRIDGFLGHDVWFEDDGKWRDLPLPYGVQQGHPVRDILGKLLINWGLTESVPGWTKMDRCELFPGQFKLARWANLPHGLIISLGAIFLLAGMTLVFSGQQNLGAILTFGPMPVILLIYLYAYESFGSRIVLSRDNLIIFPYKAPRLEFKISQIEKVEVEIDSAARRRGKKRLTLCLKDGGRAPLCTFRREWQTTEESLLDALRSRDVPIEVPCYE